MQSRQMAATLSPSLFSSIFFAIKMNLELYLKKINRYKTETMINKNENPWNHQRNHQKICSTYSKISIFGFCYLLHVHGNWEETRIKPGIHSPKRLRTGGKFKRSFDICWKAGLLLGGRNGSLLEMTQSKMAISLTMILIVFRALHFSVWSAGTWFLEFSSIHWTNA